jgi:hypothetical protein
MMPAREAAQILDLSLHQVKRILVAYRKEGAATFGKFDITETFLYYFAINYFRGPVV